MEIDSICKSYDHTHTFTPRVYNSPSSRVLLVNPFLIFPLVHFGASGGRGRKVYQLPLPVGTAHSCNHPLTTQHAQRTQIKYKPTLYKLTNVAPKLLLVAEETSKLLLTANSSCEGVSHLNGRNGGDSLTSIKI